MLLDMTSGKARHEDSGADSRWDSTAFEHLVSEHSGELLAFLRARVTGGLDAESLLQDVWLKVLIKQSQFHGGDFRAWVFAIARNHLTDAIRKVNSGGKPKVYQLDETMDRPRDDEKAATQEEAKVARLKALRECAESEEGKELVEMLLRVQEEGPAEVARREEVTTSAVYSKIHRARKKLGDCLKRKLP